MGEALRLPGRDMRIHGSFDGEPTTTFQRVVLRGRTAYYLQVLLLADGIKKPPARYQKILDSLSSK